MASALPNVEQSSPEANNRRAPSSFSGDTDSVSDISFAIQPDTNSWTGPTKSGSAQCMGGPNADVLQYLPIQMYDEFETFEMFKEPISLRKCQTVKDKEMARRALWKQAFSAEISDSQEKLLQAISSAIVIDVSKQRYFHSYKYAGHFRETLLHGGYPDSLNTPGVLAETQEQIKRSLLNLRDLNCLESYPDLPRWYISQMVTNAEKFVEAVSLYLNQQGEICQYGFTDLFAAFAAVAGLNFRNGQCVNKRSMKVLGVDVTSETDLRAYAEYVTRPDSRGKSPPRSLDVIAIAQVQIAPPNQQEVWLDSLHPLCGRLLGEMILEMPYSAIDDTVVAFAVQSTKVRACLLTLSRRALMYIQDPAHNAQEFEQEHDLPFKKGVLDWSIGLDIMKPKDRLRLWKFMMKLVNTDNKKES